MRRAFLFFAVALGLFATLRAEPVTIRSAQLWPDTAGQHINAHCGSIIRTGDTWYWFGENRTGDRSQITCYSSQDLKHWTFRNIVLKNLGNEKGFTERPKIVFNERTKKWVMWMHKEGAPEDYSEARAAVAVSDTVDGDYRFLGSFRPLGNLSRDDYLFKDDDGAAYFISAGNNNADLKLYRLSDDYLRIDRELATLYPGQFREAPVIFKHGGFYYLLTSFCTGAKSNPQCYSVAKSIAGPWSKLLPLTARRTWNTYYAQGACAFVVQGTKGSTVVFNLDRWVQPMRHVWLPLEFDADGSIHPLEWHDEWTLDAATGLAVVPPAPFPDPKNLAQGKSVTATYDEPGAMFDFGHFANHEPRLAVDGDPATAWVANDNLPHWVQVDLGEPAAITGVEITFWKKGRHTYRIETSGDGASWTTALEKEMPALGQTARADFNASGVRYVRVWALGSERGYNWTGVSELVVLADGKNIARGKPATADDFQARTDATKAVDGDFSTAWTIDNEKFPQSLTVDLGASMAVGGARILWEAAGVAHRYMIETSTDGKDWRTAIDQAANTPATPNLSLPEHRFDARNTRYVRVTLTGYDDMGGVRAKNMRPWPGIREFEVFE